MAKADGNLSPKVVTGDRPAPVGTRVMPVTVVLENLRSAFNVGNILRLAEALRIERVVAGGYTASPPHGKLARTARGCDRLVTCLKVERSADAIVGLKASGAIVYGVETVDGARSIWDADIAFPAVFVFGNEALGLSPAVLALCDDYIRLPMFGVKNSINVGNAAAVALYEAARQFAGSAYTKAESRN